DRHGGDLDVADRSGARGRAEEHALRLGAVRALLGAVPRHRRHRLRLSLARLSDGVWITRLDDGPPGRRLAVKDLFDTAGVRSTYGSAVFADHVPASSASWVAELESRGWVNVGKTNLHEFAYGVTSQNLHYGVVPNPRFPSLTAGGSSGGSAAALVLGLADAALGTDTGGSIRIPAACCGVVGLKPTSGSVSMDGVFPLAPTFDHAGPMAVSVDGCASVLGLDVPAVDDVRVASAWGGVHGEPIEFPTAE